MGSYTQPFTPDTAWYYTGMQESDVPVAPPQYFPHPNQPWGPAVSTLPPQPALGLTAAPYDTRQGAISFGTSEGSSVLDSAQLSGSLSSSSTPGRWDSHAHDLEPRRVRIKRIRTACEECRKRKQRCDGNEFCAACEEQGTVCRYRDVPPAKKDPSIDKILEMTREHKKHLESLTQGVNSLQMTLRGLEARLPRRK